MAPRRFAVLRDIRAQKGWEDLPVIVLTAMGDMDGKIRGMELGADDYVTKPFKLIELQTRINSALKVHEYRQRLAQDAEVADLGPLDPVTGAGTYAQLKASLELEMARARRYGRPLCALLYGFDDYPSVRLKLGRDVCDALVARIANEIRGSLRGADRLFRMDTDEFVVLMPETQLPGAHLIAQRLIELTRRVGPEGLTARVGGAVFPNPSVSSSEDLLREANRRFNALKTKGPDKLVFDPDEP
jgi:two-component system cell cycle response regulator